jgi:hypothetical protein
MIRPRAGARPHVDGTGRATPEAVALERAGEAIDWVMTEQEK